MAYAQKLNNIRFQAFKKQDPKLGGLDVTFDFGDKKLYAHKLMLQLISTTFESMLSERWTSSNEPIPIETYGFEDFYQFLHFLYFGECRFTDDNIFVLTDMAEFYQVAVFKEYCEEYLTTIRCTCQNVHQLLDIAMKYSLVNLKQILAPFVRSNLWKLTNDDQFFDMPNEKLLEILKLGQPFVEAEKIFERVYEWGKNQAMLKKKSNQNMNLDKTVKKVLTNFMPLFNFSQMDHCFVIEFVVAKSLIPSGLKLSAILFNSLHGLKKVQVEITDKNGKMMKGHFFNHDFEKVNEEIQRLKNVKSNICPHRHYIHWVKSGFNSCPSQRKLIMRIGVEWYLIYDIGNDLAVKHRKEINYLFDYLIAEMFAEDGFAWNQECKIKSFFV